MGNSYSDAEGRKEDELIAEPKLKKGPAEDLKVKEQEAARIRSKEDAEKDWSEDLRKKREKLLNSISSQKYLLIGSPGVGKSSLINSFNYVMNLIFDEEVDYYELAPVGGGTSSSKTQLFEEYNAKIDDGMFSEMKDERREKAPAFFDVAGIPNQSKYSALIQAMAEGKVDDETPIKPLLEAKPEDLSHQLGGRSEELLSWGIMFVVPLTELAEDGVPEALASGLAKAVQELARLRCEIPIFVIITKVDLLLKEVAEKKIQPFIELLKHSVDIEEHRIFRITNFTPSDRKEDHTMQPIKSKQIEFLDAFNQILKYKPKFMRQKNRQALASTETGSLR